jgi:hypothetical protein
MADPVGSFQAGMNSTLTTINALDQMKERRDEAPLRKRMLEQHVESGDLQIAQQQRQQAKEDKQERFNTVVRPHLAVVEGALERSAAAHAKGGEYLWSDDEVRSFQFVHGEAHSIPNNKEDFDRWAGAQKYVSDYLAKNGEAIQKANGVIQDKEFLSKFQQSTMAYLQDGKTWKDPYGNGSDKCKVDLDRAVVSNGMVRFGATFTSDVYEGQKMAHLGDGRPYFGATVPAGATQGNINLSQRPVVGHADGSISTVLTKGFGIGGKEVLLPTVGSDGKMLTDKEAKQRYKSGPDAGKHLGIFNNIQDANKYAEALHNDPIWQKDLDQYTKTLQDTQDGKKRVDQRPITIGMNPDSQAPVQPFVMSHLEFTVKAHDKLLDAYNMVLAQRPGYWEDYDKKKAAKAEGVQISKTLKGVTDAADYDELSRPKQAGRVMSALLESGVKPSEAGTIADKVTKPDRGEKKLTKTTREIKSKGQIITQESNDNGETWHGIATSPQFRPKEKKEGDGTKEESRQEKKESGMKKDVQAAIHQKFGGSTAAKDYNDLMVNAKPEQQKMIKDIEKRAMAIMKKNKGIDAWDAMNQAAEERRTKK